MPPLWSPLPPPICGPLNGSDKLGTFGPDTDAGIPPLTRGVPVPPLDDELRAFIHGAGVLPPPNSGVPIMSPPPPKSGVPIASTHDTLAPAPPSPERGLARLTAVRSGVASTQGLTSTLVPLSALNVDSVFGRLVAFPFTRVARPGRRMPECVLVYWHTMSKQSG